MSLNKARSFLFVPGHRPERFAKAIAAGAHQIIIDLEDAVGPAEKDQARRHVVAWLAGGEKAIIRINAADTPWYGEDIAALREFPGIALMLPKAEPKALAACVRALPNTPFIALIETVEGLLSLPDLVRTASLRRLAFGNLDFGADARLPGTGGVLDHARFQIALHSRSGRLPPPIDGVTIALNDQGAIEADVLRARELGFGGKLCIHPKQVAAVNSGFAPSTVDLEWARRVTEALKASGGAAVQVDGKMVDKPMIDRASALLAEAADEQADYAGVC